MKVCEAFWRETSAGTVEQIVYVFDGFHLDVTRRRLSSPGGVMLALNSRAMDGLLLLVSNAGQVVEKRRLMETIWPSLIVEDNNLNQCILAIRKALGEVAGSNRYVMTVSGRGYCFVCPVQRYPIESEEAATVPVPRSRRVALAVAALLPAVILLLSGVLHSPSSTRAKQNQPELEPSLVLRLRSPPGTREISLARMPPAALASCLANEPGLKLRVSVELVREGAEGALWSGSYAAGRQDLLSLQEGASNAGGCPVTSR